MRQPLSIMGEAFGLCNAFEMRSPNICHIFDADWIFPEITIILTLNL